MSGKQYLEKASELLTSIASTQLPAIQSIGAVIGQSVTQGGIVHLFGAGHSHIVAEEVFVRAGTLTTSRAIWPQQISTNFERVEGLGATILDLGDVQKDEVLFVISNSGINPLPIDMVIEGKRRGAVTVGIGSKMHSEEVESRHSSGNRLQDVSDHFLDTCVPAGDALIEFIGFDRRVGPGSTIAGVAIIQAVMAEAVSWMLERGYEPAVRVSRNMPGGDAHNDALAERYRMRIPELER